MLRPSLAPVLALASLLGCADGVAPSAPATPAAPGAAALAASEPAPAAQPTEDAVPPAPVEPSSVLALLRAADVREPSGAAPLLADSETVVDPAASFEVELAAELPQVRLVLVDAQDAHVAVKAEREIGGTTRLSLTPTSPLVPGSRYFLRVEGLQRREPSDARGRAFAPHQFELLAAGTPPPAQPAPPRRRR